MGNSKYHVIFIAAGCSRRLAHLTNDKPKSFLEINNKRIIEYSLDYLSERGFKKVTFVIGYLKDTFMKTIGSNYKNLQIDYITTDDYETTGHGWSTFLSREAWEKERKPVIFLHADILFHPQILDQVLAHPAQNLVGVDSTYSVLTGDEVVVTGQHGLMSGFAFGVPKTNSDSAGELIGVNKWSSDFMQQFYSFMEEFFAKNGNNHNYEPVFDAFIKKNGVTCSYIQTELPWININYEEDYVAAQEKIHTSIFNSNGAL